jgi:hypothetical protein
MGGVCSPRGCPCSFLCCQIIILHVVDARGHVRAGGFRLLACIASQCLITCIVFPPSSLPALLACRDCLLHSPTTSQQQQT